MKYGTFDSFECPFLKTKLIEAEDFLLDLLDKTNGCYMIKTEHTCRSGNYITFEIFLPDDCRFCHEEEDKITIAKYKKAIQQLTEIRKKYYTKFEKYL